jgi:hypothetical protein
MVLGRWVRRARRGVGPNFITEGNYKYLLYFEMHNVMFVSMVTCGLLVDR